ncbi:MAG: hypothetical protein GTO53_14515 [Planctomycetales bacterium]|nr:hypothetical protein [Planctomycetales bacterium]NIM10296.1 hypothetical protein [Planctomycetales bacterium]NIN09735.1 hypothetical protein [Planctomycetales bacterium]NIN78860.1 hypothetical protein [Planctomycetales bacterium]NIO36027.1 hypothetical protein [Planctomycetales bacterium]
MKAKRRQELHTNWLADKLGGQLEDVKPYVTWIVAAVLVLLVAILIFSVRSARQTSELNEGWATFDEVRQQGFSAVADNQPVQLNEALDDLQALADQFSGRPLGSLARLSLADIHLERGRAQLRENRVTAREHFQQAADQYQIVAQAVHDPTLKNRALFSLGKSYEWQRKFAKAREYYQQVAGPYRDQAQARAQQLQLSSIDTFYQKFAEWKPPAPPKAPGSRYPDLELDQQPPPVTGRIDYQRYLDDTALGLDVDLPAADPPESPPDAD